MRQACLICKYIILYASMKDVPMNQEIYRGVSLKKHLDINSSVDIDYLAGDTGRLVAGQIDRGCPRTGSRQKAA